MRHDLRFALRMLAANPGFTAVALATLALGIGANTAIFSVIDHVLLRRAPVRDIDRVAVIWETDRQTGTFREPSSLPDFLDFRRLASQVEALGAMIATEVNYTPESGEPVRLQALAVSHDLLPTLGTSPAAGRAITAEEARPGGDQVVILSDSFWTRALARDPAAVGRTVRLDDVPHRVVGIMPPRADFGVFQILSAADYSRGFADRGARAGVDVWIPLQESEETLPRSTHPIIMVGRLRGTVASAQEELAGIAADLERAYPVNRARGVHVEPLSTVVFGRVRPALLVLLAAVGLVLLVACGNVANLLLARGTARQREVAVRTALGARPWRLARQFAAEGVLLALGAALLGSAVAALGVRALVGLAPADIPRIAEASVDLRVLAIMLGVAVVSGFLFGMVPMLQARRVDLHGTLKADGGYGASAGSGRARARAVLVVVEFALAVTLVIGAALLIRSFWQLQATDPGFRADGVLKAEYQLPRSRYPVDFSRFPDFREMHVFNEGLLARAGALPGVEAAAIAGNHPLDPGFTNSFRVAGREAEGRNWPEISVRRVTPGYFRTMGVGLVRGRLLAPADATTSPPVVLINEAAARRFFEGHEPLGQRIAFWGVERTVVGVVGNERFQGLTVAPPPAVYAPLAQAPSANGAGVLLIRAAGDPAAMTGTVRRAIAEQDPALAVFGLEPLRQTMIRSVAERRFTMLVLGVLAGVALLLAAIGIHGVLSYTVSQRTREIGIRMALGADARGVRRLVVGEGMRLAAVGAGLGLASAWVLTRWITALLYGVTATDPVTFVTVPLGLTLVALIACYVPARRATRVDPVRALRAE
ncbi:MAG TPA: ABC transporter permease [Vicinamibacterales bacterium]|nr:ABC transporter permease [Vicinamibacterales bacterium]